MRRCTGCCKMRAAASTPSLSERRLERNPSGRCERGTEPPSICNGLMNCFAPSRCCYDGGEPGTTCAGGTSERAAPTGNTGVFRTSRSPCRKGDPELRAVPAGADGAGVRGTAGESDTQAATGIRTAVGEVTGQLRHEAIAAEGQPSDEGT